ncbi:MAG: GNAT family N-acetyltransferase [Chloroflexi bacterium]|nr:GNAT family N-acetyltransferase [Chloroflexota bacterium]
MMNIIYELSPSRFNLVAALFSKVWADKALIDSVLEGTRSARVFVDYDEAPTAALMCEESGNYYIVGDPRPGRLRQFIADAPAEAGVFNRPDFAFFTNQSDWRDALWEDRGGDIAFYATRVFRYSRGKVATPLDEWKERALVTADVRRIDRSLLADIESGAVRLPEQFSADFFELIFKDRFGFAAVVDGWVSSAIWAHAISSWYASAFVETVQGFRRNGLATLVTAAFIDNCLQNRLTPLWSCLADNQAAAAIALKLNFEEGPPQLETDWPPFGDDFVAPSGLWMKQAHPVDAMPDSVVWHRAADLRDM